MKVRRWITIGAVASAAAVLTALAVPPATRTFRTTASVQAVFQVPNPVATNTALLAFDTFTGSDLVNLALGTNLTAVITNLTLALEIDCGSSQASLVVFDTILASNVLTIATSTHIDALTGQDNAAAAGPNHERYVMQMGVSTNGALVGGFLTVSGRLYLDPTNGCPRTVLVDTDRKHDRGFGDAALKDVGLKVRDTVTAGDAHLIGVVNGIFVDGTTNTTLLPFGQLTERRQLLP